MKKIFFALAALVLAFTGCSQEEEAIQVSEKKAVKVVVNMDKPGFGEDARAARQGWEEGDEVIVVLDGKSNAYLKLTYTGNNENPWETAYYEYVGVDGDYVKQTSWQTIASTGTAKAAYFSSGIRGIYYSAEYVSIKSNAEIFNRGECVMTCEDGTYSASGGVLTLDITMKPQVAQYTIRNLNVTDGWNIAIEGPVNGYAGGKITTDGVELTLIEDALYCYPHQNGNDISIFAAPWQSNEDIPDFIIFPPGYEFTEDSYKLPYVFAVQDDANGFVREFDYKEVAIGGAVIMDGPYTEDEDGNKTAGAQEWEE